MRMRAAVCMLGSMLAWSSIGSSLAFADSGVTLSRFEPSERGSRFFFADSLELGHPDAKDRSPLVAAGMPTSYEHGPSTWGTKPEGRSTSLVGDALWLHPGASLTVHPGARFAVDVPVVLYQHGEDTNLAGRFYPAPSSPRIGDVRASFTLNLLGPSSRDVDGIALAVSVLGWLPTGSADNYVGDDYARFGGNLSSAARYGAWLFAARVGYMYRRDGYFGGARVGPEMNAVLAAGYVTHGFTVGPEVHAESEVDTKFAKRATPIEGLFGAHEDFALVSGSLRIGAGIGTAFVYGLGAAELRGLVSVEWISGGGAPRDRDQDGVPDHSDVCPDVWGPAASQGCPLAPSVTPDGPTIQGPPDLPAESEPKLP